MEGPEVESLRAALKRAKKVKKALPLDVHVAECEGFLSRGRAHLTELDAKRAVVSANFQDAEQRLDALKIQFSTLPRHPFRQTRIQTLRQLRETVAQLKGQLPSVKPTVTSEGPASKRPCRREEFRPHCVEELQKWIGG